MQSVVQSKGYAQCKVDVPTSILRVTFVTTYASQQNVWVGQPSRWTMTLLLNVRYDPSDGKHYANKTSISKRLAAVYPSKGNDQASLEVANNGAANRPSLVHNDEL